MKEAGIKNCPVIPSEKKEKKYKVVNPSFIPLSHKKFKNCILE